MDKIKESAVEFSKDLEKAIEGGATDAELVDRFGFENEIELDQARRLAALFKSDPDEFKRQSVAWERHDQAELDAKRMGLLSAEPRDWQAVHDLENLYDVPSWLRLTDAVQVEEPH